MRRSAAEVAALAVSGVLVLVGIALIVIAVARDAGVLVVVGGGLFIVLGAGRIGLSCRRRS